MFKAKIKKSPSQQRTPLKDSEFFKNWKKTAKAGDTFPREDFMKHQALKKRTK